MQLVYDALPVLPFLCVTSALAGRIAWLEIVDGRAITSS